MVLFWVAWVILVSLRGRSAPGGFQWLVVWRWEEGPDGLDPVRFGASWCRLLSMNERLSHSAALGESLPAPHLLDIVTRHTGATICVVDTSLNILYANEAYANWF